MKIAIALATRGLVFTEVEQSIEVQRKSYDIEVFRSSNLPLPESQNYLAERALETNAPYILFVEEDTVIPHYGIAAMLRTMKEQNADIVCIDYGVNGWSCTARERETKELLWCGLGCTLVKREVLEVSKYPYFSSQLSLRLNDWRWVTNKEPYGQQDIRFCMKAREKGFKIAQVPGLEAKHLRLDSLGKLETNKGLHQISQKPVIAKQQWIDIPQEHAYSLTLTGKLDIVENIAQAI